MRTWMTNAIAAVLLGGCVAGGGAATESGSGRPLLSAESAGESSVVWWDVFGLDEAVEVVGYDGWGAVVADIVIRQSPEQGIVELVEVLPEAGTLVIDASDGAVLASTLAATEQTNAVLTALSASFEDAAHDDPAGAPPAGAVDLGTVCELSALGTMVVSCAGLGALVAACIWTGGAACVTAAQTGPYLGAMCGFGASTFFGGLCE